MGAQDWLVAASALLSSAPAHPASDAVLRYDIPAQPFDQALLQLGTQSGRQITFAPGSVRGKTSRALRGRYTFAAALAEMLRGQDLKADIGARVVLILPEPTAPPSPPPQPGKPPAAPESPPEPSSSAPPLTEVAVTAMKRETLAQMTPASISLQNNGLGDRGDVSINDYFRRAPGLRVIGNYTNLQRLSIRGVRSSGEATTGVYYDETPVTGPAGSAADAGSTQPDLNLFDTQRIEILRGPQGTLYGAGSMGGTVRVIFNKPDPTEASARVELRARATEGGDPGASLRIMGNLPLIENQLAARIVLYSEQSGGYIDNVRFGRDNINGARQSGVRASVAYSPTPALSFLGSVIHQWDASDAINYWFPRLGRYNTDASTDGFHKSDIDLYNLTARWELSQGTLIATASRYGWKTVDASDYTDVLRASAADPVACSAYFAVAACDGGQASIYDAYAQSRIPGTWYQPATLHAESQEVRMTAPPGARVDWTLGYFHELRRDHFDSVVYRVDPATGTVLNLPDDITGYRTVQTSVSQRAFFGEANLNVTRKLTLTAGARRYRYDKSVGGEVIIPNRITGSEVTPYSEVDAVAEGWVTKFAAAYQFSPDVMAYAVRSEGFRPGGANNVPGAGTAVPETYAPDRLASYELGLKTGWFDRHLRVNAAAYHIDWKDMQVGASSPTGAWRFNTNAGSAKIDGGEVEAVFTPIAGLYLSANLAYTSAFLATDQRTALGVATGVAGDRLPYTPRWTGAVSALYRWPAFRSYRVSARFDYAYTGSSASNFHPGLATYQIQPAYGLVDVQLGVDRGGVEVYARIGNLFDLRAPLQVSASQAGVRDQTYSTLPRTLTLALVRRF